MSAMTALEAVAALNGLSGRDDPAADHIDADIILLRMVPPEVAKAYKQLVARADWWAYA